MASHPKDFVGKKQTNKQQQTKTSARGATVHGIFCVLIFGLYDVRYLFLPNTSNGLLFLSTLVSLKSSFCEFDILSIGWFVNSVYQFQSEEEKRILKQKKPLERMDNDITETDYKGEKKNTISPLYN